MTPKTKTSSIIPQLNDPGYKRSPIPEIQNMNKQETRTIIMARFGMLECGKNYGGSLHKQCGMCKSVDDENHRLNTCIRWTETNLHKSNTKTDFNQIYLNDHEVLKKLIETIQRVWNTKNGNGSMSVN